MTVQLLLPIWTQEAVKLTELGCLSSDLGSTDASATFLQH